jgi:5-formyltetrahydrofolate cyclo-ligase
MEKNILRAHLRQKREAFQPAQTAEKSKKIAKAFLKLKEVADAKSILFYVSRAGEVDTHGLIEVCLRNGKKVFVPKVFGDNLKIFPLEDFQDLEEGGFGILEPAGGRESMRKKFDVIVVPGLGFNRAGHRIGHGGGYYDRLLKRISGKKIGLAFSEQFTDEFVHEEYDVPVNLIITENFIHNPIKNG